MYFPPDMNFQYFFFNTYPGYFLQMLPFALLAGAAYVIWKGKRDKTAPLGRRVLASLFVCYVTALFCLTLFFKLIGHGYYYLFYHMDSGINFHWFNFEYYLIPDFYRHLRLENLANLFLFLPFGVLYPLFRRGASWGRTVLAGLATSLTIELLQPIFGRSFDVNDIILNTIGTALSAAAYCAIRALCRRA